MTEYSSKTLRAAMKAKASRLASGSDATKIGASDFTPAEALNADIQTGARPLTRRRFKSGGKVVGAANAPRADKKKRGNSDLSADSFINRNVVEANEEREGKKHIGAFKKGGRAKHATDGKVPMPPKMPPDIRASRAMEAANSKMQGKNQPVLAAPAKEAAPERDPSIPTAAEEARMRAASAASTAANAADARRQAEKDRFDAIGQKRGGKAEADCGSGGMKKGGRAKKFMGGPMMQPGGMMGAKPPVDERVQIVDKNRMNFGTGPSGSPYKKGGKVAFEGTSKDAMQDTKLAKKYGMSMMAWEKSKQDKKHDEQESMTGLKKGGRAKKKGGGELSGLMGGLIPMAMNAMDDKDEKKHGGRAKRASGGKTGKGKGKTNISIVIATGKGQQDGMMPDNGGMPPKMPSPAMPVQTAPAAGMPPMAGAGAPPPQMPMGAPPMPAGMDKMMPRKAGGRVYKSYKDMDAGSGSGLGRLEKTDIAKRTAHKHGGKAYKSYKNMDAGAASGMGRLEKTEIAARGR